MAVAPLALQPETLASTTSYLHSVSSLAVELNICVGKRLSQVDMFNPVVPRDMYGRVPLQKRILPLDYRRSQWVLLGGIIVRPLAGFFIAGGSGRLLL